MDRITRFLDHFRPGPYPGYTQASWDDETRRINDELRFESRRIVSSMRDQGYDATLDTDPETGQPVIRFTKDVERG